MRIRAGDILLLGAAAVVIGGCGMPQMYRNRAAKPRRAYPATTMPAGANLVKVFDEAVALVADLQYKQAADKFHSVVNPLDEAGDRRRAAEAVFWFGYCREKLADREIGVMNQRYLDSAAKLYKRLIEYYPKTVAAARATERLAALKGETGEP